MSDSTLRHHVQLCPVCSRALDSASNLTGERKPTAGDYTICMYCFAVLRFDSDLHLVQVSQDEVPKDVREAQDAVEFWASVNGGGKER
jgi:hypothetical protein